MTFRFRLGIRKLLSHLVIKSTSYINIIKLLFWFQVSTKQFEQYNNPKKFRNYEYQTNSTFDNLSQIFNLHIHQYFNNNQIKLLIT